MQDRQGEAFVIATANDVESLPPELLRKGRFDEVWFVDLPTAVEREEIVLASLKAHGRGQLDIDSRKIAAACTGFTGAEVAAIVPEALFAAFAENGRELTTDDLVAAAADVYPLAKTAAEKITRLRKWADERARKATSVPVEEWRPGAQLRALDL